LQHARPPCPSLTPGVHSNSRIAMLAGRFFATNATWETP